MESDIRGAVLQLEMTLKIGGFFHDSSQWLILGT